MELLSIMDRGYEKLSIRDSARSLKKYGSTSRHVIKSDKPLIKHLVTNDDTLQGISLKYDVTIEELRRLNKLWASDSLFLRNVLYIPAPDGTVANGTATRSNNCINNNSVPADLRSPHGYDSDEGFNDFLGKIDASIASTKEDVKKVQVNGEYGQTKTVDRWKSRSVVSPTNINNNVTSSSHRKSSSVVQHGRKVKTYLQLHEQQQAELFEL